MRLNVCKYRSSLRLSTMRLGSGDVASVLVRSSSSEELSTVMGCDGVSPSDRAPVLDRLQALVGMVVSESSLMPELAATGSNRESKDKTMLQTMYPFTGET